jgi:NTP pyrophosphatase (non-canonical NTP hydrolase)
VKSWRDYDVALRKWDTKGETKIPLLVASAGVSGEVGELMEELTKSEYGVDIDSTVLEMGDVLWYVRAIGNTVGFSMEHLVTNCYTATPFFSFDRSAVRIGVLQGKVADIIKKHSWHGKGLNGLDDQLLELVGEIAMVAQELGVDLLTEVAQANVDKLEYRYPEGFVEGGGRR